MKGRNGIVYFTVLHSNKTSSIYTTNSNYKDNPCLNYRDIPNKDIPKMMEYISWQLGLMDIGVLFEIG